MAISKMARGRASLQVKLAFILSKSAIFVYNCSSDLSDIADQKLPKSAIFFYFQGCQSGQGCQFRGCQWSYYTLLTFLYNFLLVSSQYRPKIAKKCHFQLFSGLPGGPGLPIPGLPMVLLHPINLPLQGPFDFISISLTVKKGRFSLQLLRGA